MFLPLTSHQVSFSKAVFQAEEASQSKWLTDVLSLYALTPGPAHPTPE